MFSYYKYKIINYNPVTMIYYLNEYEFVGIRPDTDKSVYKHRRSFYVPKEQIKDYIDPNELKRG